MLPFRPSFNNKSYSAAILPVVLLYEADSAAILPCCEVDPAAILLLMASISSELPECGLAVRTLLRSQWIHEGIYESTYKSVRQGINQSINQSINP